LHELASCRYVHNSTLHVSVKYILIAARQMSRGTPSDDVPISASSSAPTTDGDTAALVNMRCTIAGGKLHNRHAEKSCIVHRLISLPVVNALCHSLALVFRPCNKYSRCGHCKLNMLETIQSARE
jgi:hypothetical protein